MYDILMILVDFLWKFSMKLANFLLSGLIRLIKMKRIQTDPDPKHCQINCRIRIKAHSTVLIGWVKYNLSRSTFKRTNSSMKLFLSAD